VSAVVAPTVVDGPDVALRAFTYVVGQWPAAMVTAGFAALLVGLRPRLAFLAWVPLVASGLLALLGDLLGVPQAMQDLGILRHVPDVAVDPDPRALLVLVTVAAVTGLAGVVGTTRRDVTPG
jgi:ABC-2 type transport system permease protein